MSSSSITSQLPTPLHTFQVDALSVQVYQSETKMAMAAAQLVQSYLQDVLSRQGRAAITLATGNSQIKFLEALFALEGVDWSRINFFHLDEYLGIDAAHTASFRRYLRTQVERRVNPAAFHYIEGDAMQPLAECDRYTQLLRAQPIDLCFLGVGENGHLAFNEPSVADFNDDYGVKIVKLELATRQQQVNGGHFPTLVDVPQYAFTLTIPMLCDSKKIICLASEKRKAEVIFEMLRGAIGTTTPASVLRTKAQAMLFLDRDAASLL